MKITYVFASRSRPEKFFAAIDNITEMSKSSDYDIICSLDYDDRFMKKNEIIPRLLKYQNLEIYYDTSKNKIHAINRELSRISPWTKIIICMSDDFTFLVKGYDDMIREDMEKYFPDTGGILHYPDGGSEGKRVMTISIIGRKYFDRTGYIYNPEYVTWFSDEEETEKAKLLGKYQFINRRLFRHDHYILGTGIKDALNIRNDQSVLIEKDRETFNRRKLINFGV